MHDLYSVKFNIIEKVRPHIQKQYTIIQLVLMLPKQEAHMFTSEILSEMVPIKMKWLVTNSKEWTLNAVFMKTLM